jgi:predicted xylose isomerase-like sugar epimerase
MSEYRAKIGDDRDEGLPAQEAPASTIPAYLELAEAYGMPEMDIGNVAQGQQTLDEEYQAYVTAQCSSKGTDILKFWEAGAPLVALENH